MTLQQRERLLLAAVLAVLVHILALPWFPHRQTPRVIALHVTPLRLLVLRPTPKPRATRRPQPRPTPRPKIIHVQRRVVHVARSHEGAKMRGVVRHKLPRRLAKAPPRVMLRHELVRRTAPPVLVMASSVPSQMPVASNGMNGTLQAGAAVSGGGAAGTADQGNGSGSQGNGSGSGAIPCGALDLVSLREKDIRGQGSPGVPPDALIRIEHTIRATTHYADGHSESAEFPYPFIYGPNEVDPFSHANRNNPNVLILAQFPPPGFDRSTLTPIIQSILKRTSSEGISLLLPCSENVAP